MLHARLRCVVGASGKSIAHSLWQRPVKITEVSIMIVVLFSIVDYAACRDRILSSYDKVLSPPVTPLIHCVLANLNCFPTEILGVLQVA